MPVGKGECGLRMNSKGRREHKKHRGGRPECKTCQLSGGEVILNKTRGSLEVVRSVATVSFN